MTTLTAAFASTPTPELAALAGYAPASATLRAEAAAALRSRLGVAWISEDGIIALAAHPEETYSSPANGWQYETRQDVILRPLGSAPRHLIVIDRTRPLQGSEGGEDESQTWVYLAAGAGAPEKLLGTLADTLPEDAAAIDAALHAYWSERGAFEVADAAMGA